MSRAEFVQACSAVQVRPPLPPSPFPFPLPAIWPN